MAQGQMFPLTETERIARIRSKLATAEESARTKRDQAEAALGDATEKWEEASAMLLTFDDMTGVVAAARVAIDQVGVDVDPATGEVTSPPDLPTADQAEDRLTAAIRLVVATGAASVGLLQRRLSIGYAEAAALIDAMEKAGVVAPSDGGTSRSVLIDQEGLDAALLEAALERAKGDVEPHLRAVADHA